MSFPMAGAFPPNTIASLTAPPRQRGGGEDRVDQEAQYGQLTYSGHKAERGHFRDTTKATAENYTVEHHPRGTPITGSLPPQSPLHYEDRESTATGLLSPRHPPLVPDPPRPRSLVYSVPHGAFAFRALIQALSPRLPNRAPSLWVRSRSQDTSIRTRSHAALRLSVLSSHHRRKYPLPASASRAPSERRTCICSG